MAKLLSTLNLGPAALLHRAVIPGIIWNATATFRPPPTLHRAASPGGLVISHPLPVSMRGRHHPQADFLDDPGLWRTRTAAVRAKGGYTVAQLTHAGRLAHSSVTGQRPLGPCAQPAGCLVYGSDGRRHPAETPEILDAGGIDAVRAEFHQAAVAAHLAGFDGVELGAAEGGLLDQFLQDGSNHRADDYGGEPAKRAVLLLEVLEEVISVWGAERVGVRLSPCTTMHAMWDSAPIDLFEVVLRALNEREIAYVHLVSSESRRPGPGLYGEEGARRLRAALAWPLFISGAFRAEEAMAAVESRWADAVGFAMAEDGVKLVSDLRDAAEARKS